LRRREEEERRRREEEEERRKEEERRQQVQQPLTIEEETAIIAQKLEEQRRLQQHQQQLQVAPGVPEDGEKRRERGEEREEEGRKRIDFDDVVKLLQRERDPKKVAEKLREMGYDVEEVSEPTGAYTYRYGWIVKASDRYIAITSGHRVGYGDVGDYVAMELPDRDVARNFLVGRYWGTSWGDPEFVRRAAEATVYERELDRWMREELGKAGYRVERIEWPERAPARGFTYIIYDRGGRKIGEVQAAKVGDRLHLIDTGLPPAVKTTGDPRVAALYLVYKHETGDENLAWRLATGDERTKELLESRMRYEQELKAREEWFRELTEKMGLKPIAYSRINGRPVVSENDLFLDERTGVTYRVVLERQEDRIAMKLVPATERDERLLALKSLESEGFKAIDDRTVEKDGVRYVVRIEEREGKKMLRLEPHPEDAKKAAEREVWWELWRQGFVRRGEYAVKDGVRYRVEVVEQDGRYVVRLTPVGPASPEEEPRRYRRGDQRGSLLNMKQIQFFVEKFGFERPLSPEELAEELRFGDRRPRDVPYVPALDEVFYGAFGVPLSQTLFSPTAPQLYQRYATATLPGPRIHGFTLPERHTLERAAEIQRQYAERFADVWTPLTLRAPTERDIGWRTAVAATAEAFTFWVPAVKGAAALAAARGIKIPGLTAEKTAVTGHGVRLPKVLGDYFEIHYVEPRRLDETVRGAFIGQGVGEGAAIRGAPGHWEAVFARSVGKPEPGWAFEFATVTYRDVADWLKRIPSLGVKTELRPKILRFTEVRGFARDLEPPKVELPKVEMPRAKGKEVKVEWREETPRAEQPAPKAPDEAKPPIREPPRAEPEPPRRVETPRRETVAKAEEVPRVAAKVARAEEDLVRPIRAELPVAVPVKARAGEGAWRVEPRGVSAETPAVAPAEVSVPARQETSAFGRALVGRAAERLVDTQLRELGYMSTRYAGFVAPSIRPFDVRAFETPVELFERLRALETSVWAAEVPGVRTVGRETAGRRVADGFAAPSPPPPYVRGGGYGGWRETVRALPRPPRLDRRGWRIYELLRI
jgi:hypothetical protein